MRKIKIINGGRRVVVVAFGHGTQSSALRALLGDQAMMDEKERYIDWSKKMLSGLPSNYQKATKPLFKTPLYKNKLVFLVILLILLITYLVAEYAG